MNLKKVKKVKKNRPTEEIEKDIRNLMEKLYGENLKDKPLYNKEKYQEKAKRLKEFHSWYR